MAITLGAVAAITSILASAAWRVKRIKEDYIDRTVTFGQTLRTRHLPANEQTIANAHLLAGLKGTSCATAVEKAIEQAIVIHRARGEKGKLLVQAQNAEGKPTLARLKLE